MNGGFQAFFPLGRWCMALTGLGADLAASFCGVAFMAAFLVV
ncbi:hypothetical protein [Desulfocurvus sp.]|nr:hypothetical protein [Desulfocurvus sp.]